MALPVVDQALLDEALRVGNKSVDQANRYMRINRGLTDGIIQALEFLKSGRTDKARDRLDRALVAASKLLQP